MGEACDANRAIRAWCAEQLHLVTSVRTHRTKACPISLCANDMEHSQCQGAHLSGGRTARGAIKRVQQKVNSARFAQQEPKCVDPLRTQPFVCMLRFVVAQSGSHIAIQ